MAQPTEKKGFDCECSGIGGKYECPPGGLWGFTEHTGGTLLQRLHDRNYSKEAHAVSPSDVPPLLDISMLNRVL